MSGMEYLDGKSLENYFLALVKMVRCWFVYEKHSFGRDEVLYLHLRCHFCCDHAAFNSSAILIIWKMKKGIDMIGSSGNVR